MTRTTLFLHTERPTRRVLERERPEGRLILATDSVEPQDVAFYDEVVALPPVGDVVGTLARLRRIPADEIVVQTEHGPLAGSLLAAERGIAAPSPQAALLTTNKWLCREALAAARVPVPRFALASNADDVRRFAADRGPVVVKPVASTLGHLVTKVVSPRDADAVVARLVGGLPRSPHVLRCREFARLAGLDMDCDPLRQFLVEEFAGGPPLETDGLVFGRRTDVFGVSEQVVSAPPWFFIEAYLFPVAHAGLAEISRAAVAALGLDHAGFSIEFRGGVVIEVNGRLGEDDGFPDLFHAALGHWPILKALARDATPSIPRAGGSALAYVNSYAGGVVRAAPRADGVTIVAVPGTRLHAPPHPEAAPHLAYALASDPRGARAAWETARAAVAGLRFEIEPA